MILEEGQRVRYLDDPDGAKGTVEGIVPGTENRGDKIVYFVRWDDDGHDESARHYESELAMVVE